MITGSMWVSLPADRRCGGNGIDRLLTKLLQRRRSIEAEAEFFGSILVSPFGVTSITGLAALAAS